MTTKNMNMYLEDLNKRRDAYKEAGHSATVQSVFFRDDLIAIKLLKDGLPDLEVELDSNGDVVAAHRFDETGHRITIAKAETINTPTAQKKQEKQTPSKELIRAQLKQQRPSMSRSTRPTENKLTGAVRKTINKSPTMKQQSRDYN